MYPASPVSAPIPQQNQNEITATNETQVNEVALNALRVLSGMLLATGIGCLIASLVVPAVSCIVVGVALIIFLVRCADEAIPCREEINPSNITSDSPSRNVSSTPDSSSEVTQNSLNLNPGIETLSDGQGLTANANDDQTNLATASLDPLDTSPVETQTDPISLVDPYPELTQAREELLSWFDKQGSELGKGDYYTLIEKINTLSQDLPKKKMTLYCDYFTWGFSLFSLEKTEEKKWMPLTKLERIILNWQTDETPDACLPLKDPEDNSYFIPDITRKEAPGTHSRNQQVQCYLYILAYTLAFEPYSNSPARHTLEGLTSYASQIKDLMDNDMYQILRQKIPSYPDL